ncbi:cyclin N-terminal domain-containing protein 1 [Larimichthys crocea]|uniref:cyclin N-terminal domain-containing protein 1 n=1 Tax=Larimichthys crocea TaxID=215358 RepID=UPI000F5EAC19|nr:cyclin N-terminal domain-containing protein 1 [Larimichthys crocea]
MAKRFFSPPNESISLKFREAPFELLTDFLVNLNTRNKDKLDGLSKCSGNFKDERLVEYIFLMTKELRLDPLTGYHAVELLQRFMVRHLTDMLTAPSPPGAAADPPRSLEDALFDKLKKKFPLIIFSCVQLASKLSLHSHIIDNNTAVRFLHSLGHSVSKQTLVESELMVLKGLEFRLNPPNPLTYVEILLEVLAHNRPSIPLEHLYHLCHYVLQFISLHRTAIFDSLLATTTQSVSPSGEQREKFVTVTEDYMLLGVGVIAVASFILYGREWKQMVGELSHITGISRRSISDYAHVTLMHIVRGSFPLTST